MDLLRREKDRQDVRQRLERFVQGQNIITGENRVHFISAQAALDAILAGTEDEYLKAFQSFTQSIEKFLAVERGSLEIKRFVTKIKDLIQESLYGLHQSEEVLDGKVNLSEAEKQKILEQIGEASGRDVRIRLLANTLVDEVIEEANESWDAWVDGLGERLAEKVDQWSSKHSAIWSRDELVKDYTNQFNRNLSTELDIWIENELKQKILTRYVEQLGTSIEKEIETLESSFYEINKLINNKSTQNWVFSGTSAAADMGGVFGNIGLAGLGAALLLPTFIFAGPILFIVGNLMAGGLLGSGVGGVLGFDAKIREKVFEVGCEQFVTSLEDIFEKINEIIAIAFDEKVGQANEIIAKAISFYENLLEQQEKAHQETQEQRETEKAFISQKRNELEQVQRNIEAIIHS
jgi:hypothetical protein